MVDEKESLTKTWQQYIKGKQYLSSKGYYRQLEKNNNFFIGDQWDKESKNLAMPMPQDNVITPVCLYKIGIVAQNNMTITYNSDNVSQEDLQEIAGTNFKEIADKIMTLLNEQANKFWEANNLETDMWDYIEECCVSGTVNMYINVLEDKEVPEMVLGNNIHFSDENDPDIQAQQYILITFRRPVEKVKEEARRNGIKPELIEEIVADRDTNEQIGNRDEVDTEDGKCLCVLKLYKKEVVHKRTIIDEATGMEIEEEERKTTVHMTKSTRTVEYVPETDLAITLYPVAKMDWKKEKNNARGRGEPQDKINNQIEINKTLARRDLAILMTAYPKLVYLENKVKNTANFDKVGVAIGITGQTVTDIKQAIDYLNPAQISPDAKNFADELASKTKESAGAGDAALGNVDPTEASGKAILAVKDSSAVPINVHVSRYKRFVEDIARILFDIWQNTSVEGKKIAIEEKDDDGNVITTIEEIPYGVLQRLKVSVKVDVSATDPFSKYAQEQSWENLFTNNKITFEEWVSGLPNNSISNKAKLEEIIRKRKEVQQQQEDIEDDIKAKQYEAQKVAQQIANSAMMGGATNEMQQM